MDEVSKGFVMIKLKFTFLSLELSFAFILSFLANTSFAHSSIPITNSSIIPGNISDSVNLTTEEIGELREKLALLEEKAFMPTILPIIMQNKEALQLSESQITHFVDWRKKNLKSVINMMTLIIEKHIAFKKAALNPEDSGKDLLKIQNEIFELQRKVLQLKLECRNYLTETFNEEQWENFSFLLSEHPKLASFLN